MDLWESYVAGPWASAASFAIFSDYTGMDGDPLEAETGENLDLSATLDILNQDWVDVYALLTPPSPGEQVVGEFETPVLEQILVTLTFEEETGETDYFGKELKVFGGTGYPLHIPGEWELTYFVTDQNNELTASYPVTLNVSGDPLSQKQDLNVISGWNLLALPLAPVSNNVEVLFADISDNIESAWKWENGGWAVLLPGEEPQGAYAGAKGFSVLSSINPGEGFWVNSVGSETLSIEGTATTGNLTLTLGWNLAGLKSDQGKTVIDLISGNKDNIASVWKWDNGKWAVYLPGENGGGDAYAKSKSFTLLSNIEPGEGFWVNCNEGMVLE
jgi:hypothetical protein